jgi:hypothetical protein
MERVERIEIMRAAEGGRGGHLPGEPIEDAAGRGCLKKTHW